MTYPQLQLNSQICHRLYKASNGISRAYRTWLSELDLTYPQYVVMMALWEENQLSIATLVEKTGIDGGAMTQILKKMSDKGLLTIVKDQDDKRKRWVTLTGKGIELQHQAAAIPEKIRCKFPSIDDEQAQHLIALLDMINHDLGESDA
ncbi:MarR family transcriptional regulator [Salinivibrio sp. ML198]|uniref:MarR family transcriptional regulator n=1 Tax=Salinivibrio kushneri TaxID=1908198 RepID=A0AA47KMH3_9GAMM|nr:MULTISPECIES: MarR family transcriptional regulator [Salinivibrio]OOE81894.1 MarR family transcriptional regulator [Salinivibrio sp. ML198]WBA09696.1 MarR family transcriptional regulator [Salinivibrio kushneri]